LKIDRILKNSVSHAFDNPNTALDFIRAHAQEMDEEVMYKHIDLYVNNFTKDLGKVGRKAIDTLYQKALELDLIPEVRQKIFID
jgi:1,4-dihydroxy-6-naphthoate synthase